MPALAARGAHGGRGHQPGRSTASTSRIEPAWLLASREEIRSAFTNLVTNAIRYTPAGGDIARHLGHRGRRADAARARQRRRHRAGAPPAPHRALLPRGPQPLALLRRHGAGARHREARPAAPPGRGSTIASEVGRGQHLLVHLPRRAPGARPPEPPPRSPPSAPPDRGCGEGAAGSLKWPHDRHPPRLPRRLRRKPHPLREPRAGQAPPLRAPARRHRPRRPGGDPPDGRGPDPLPRPGAGRPGDDGHLRRHAVEHRRRGSSSPGASRASRA